MNIDRHIRKHWPRKARKRYQRAWEASDEALRERCLHWSGLFACGGSYDLSDGVTLTIGEGTLVKV